MNHLEHTYRQLRRVLWLALSVWGVLLLGTYWVLRHYVGLKEVEASAATIILSLTLSFLLSKAMASYALSPLKTIWQIILHLSPTEQGMAAPDKDSLRL